MRQLEILGGWKEIANYLGKGVRTVQRYECELGLPIRRPAGRSTGSVIATKAEIDAWISASPLREASSLSLRYSGPRKAMQQLREQLVEMHRLRVESAQWRHEVAAARQSLHQSIAVLHKRLRDVLGEDPEPKRPTADVLTFDPKRKAN
jgi:hypothetical protein